MKTCKATKEQNQSPWAMFITKLGAKLSPWTPNTNDGRNKWPTQDLHDTKYLHRRKKKKQPGGQWTWEYWTGIQWNAGGQQPLKARSTSPVFGEYEKPTVRPSFYLWEWNQNWERWGQREGREEEGPDPHGGGEQSLAIPGSKLPNRGGGSMEHKTLSWPLFHLNSSGKLISHKN